MPFYQDIQPAAASVNWTVVGGMAMAAATALFGFLTKSVFPAWLEDRKAQRAHEEAMVAQKSSEDRQLEQRLFDMIERNTAFLGEMRVSFPRIVDLLTSLQDDVTDLRIDVASIATAIQHELPSKNRPRKRGTPAQSDPAQAQP